MIMRHVTKISGCVESKVWSYQYKVHIHTPYTLIETPAQLLMCPVSNYVATAQC